MPRSGTDFTAICHSGRTHFRANNARGNDTCQICSVAFAQSSKHLKGNPMSMQHNNLSIRPDVKAFFDPITNTISYVVSDPVSHACAVLDSVLDMDYAAGRITYDHADGIVD